LTPARVHGQRLVRDVLHPAMTDFFEMPDGSKIAFRLTQGSAKNTGAPTIVFLPGYMSDMAGSKATALFDWARANGHGCLLLDYSGCGESDGDFADGTLSRWRDEVLALIDAKVQGPVLLVGSSMGGWLMLLVGLALGERLAGMVGIAAAPDFSDWGYSAEQKAMLQAGQTVLEDNPYGPEPTPTHAAFWTDAQTQRLLDAPIPVACPVTLLQGQRDADVSWETALRLAERLDSAKVLVQLVKDGDHRLSRPEDVARLLAIVEQHLLSA
jgi:pimeloyl-ACP methyl ester carboxylesterase